MNHSHFITFEGIDGAGKSTILERLANEWRFMVKPCFTREPGGSSIGSDIRAVLLNRETPLSPEVAALLFTADRFQHLEEVIHPALKSGKVVFSDRFIDSTYAYQVAAMGLDKAYFETLVALDSLRPSLTFLLDLPSEVALARLNQLNREAYELKGKDFMHKVREGFLGLQQKEPERFYQLDATKPTDLLFEEVTTQLLRHFSRFSIC